MYKLDSIDKNLLKLLDQDARQPATMLANRLGISKQVTSFRLRRLKKLEIVQEYSAYIDRAKLGYSHYQLYLKLKKYEKSKLYTDLSFIPHIHWCARSRGKYNLVIYFLTKSQQSCYEAFNAVTNTFSGYIKSKEFLATSKSHYFSQSAITYMEKKEIMVQKLQKKPMLKKTDFNLLNLIKTDARISLSRISKTTGVNTRTIRDRIRYLKKIGVIKNFRARLDFKKLGYSHYQLFLETSNLPKDAKKEIISKLLSSRQVIRLTETLGKWEISCDVVIPKRNSLRSWISKNMNGRYLAKMSLSNIEIIDELGINTSRYN